MATVNLYIPLNRRVPREWPPAPGSRLAERIEKYGIAPPPHKIPRREYRNRHLLEIKEKVKRMHDYHRKCVPQYLKYRDRLLHGCGIRHIGAGELMRRFTDRFRPTMVRMIVELIWRYGVHVNVDRMLDLSK